MTTTSPDCQVLVVGAGPTGLTLAAQLLGRGIPTRIVDRSQRPSPFSRALGVHGRTLELLNTMGLADAFLAEGHRVRHMHMYTGGRTLLDLDLGYNGSAYGFVLHIPQQRTEHLLRARVRELGGTVEDGVELVRLSARDDAVDVTMRDRAGRDLECTAGYVVGCDGAHSQVRHQLGLAFEGQPYAQDWLLADVTLEGAGSNDEAHLFFRPNGLPLTCLPMGGDRWRVVLPNAGDRGGRPPSLAEIQELVGERAPWRLELGAPQWLSCFRCQLRSTTSYRRGRVFLAGDAAHIHSPAAGQGMNTGMMDAANLAWKLALVADGRAPDRMLDTYEQERLPVAAQVIGFTDRFVGLMTMRRPVQRALRDSLVPRFAGLPAVQRRAAGRVSQVSVGYPTSALTRPHRDGREPRPGERVPDVQVRSGGEPARLYEVLRGGRHVLLRWPGPDPQAAAPAGLDGFDSLVDVVHGRLDTTHGPGAVALVRPDGFLAAHGLAADTDRVAAYLRHLTGTTAPAAEAPPPAVDLAAEPTSINEAAASGTDGRRGSAGSATLSRRTAQRTTIVPASRSTATRPSLSAAATIRRVKRCCRRAWTVVTRRPRSHSSSSSCALGLARGKGRREDRDGPDRPIWSTTQYPWRRQGTDSPLSGRKLGAS